MPYQPRPIDTAHVDLPVELHALIERLAEHIHDVWALQRLADGWCYGPARNDALQQHPGLVSYSELSESEKAYDRNTAMQAIKAAVALGYRVVRDEPAAS